jgi:PAS domain S-box-containing protein
MSDYADLTRADLISRIEELERRLSSEASPVAQRSASEEKYEALFENMIEEIHFWQLVRDKLGNIKTWRLVDINPAAEKSWGMKRADIIGKTADQIFPTATEHFMPIVTKIFRENKAHSWESYFPDLKQHMKFSSVPFGEHFFTTGFDITDTKISQLRQEKLGMMAKMATEASKIGVWELDLDTGHLTWNEQMLKIFGTEPEKLRHTAQDWSDRLHPDDKEEMLAKLHRSIESGESFVEKFRIVTPSGETRIIKAHSELLQSETSQSSILIGTNTDITEEENLIKELQLSKEIANESNAAKSEFLASMSHELRTPMNAVLGYTQMLQLIADDRLSDKEKQYLNDILESGHYLLTLINDVLDLSQIDAGSLEVDEQDLNIQEILTQAETIIRPISEKRQIKIERRSVLSCKPHIRSDRVRVNQILLNLLSNGVKHSPQGGLVTLTATVVGASRLRIAVTDSGPGIAPSDQALIFNPFTRLHRTSMTTAEGIGIGLAISKKLAEQLGGTIGVDSQVGKGSTFWIEFPCEACDAACPDLSCAQSA